MDKEEWEEPELIESWVWEGEYPFELHVTNNSRINLLYIKSGIRFRYYDTFWTNSFMIDYSYPISMCLSGVSNDLFISWQDYMTGDIKYRQYDAAPLAPQSLAVTKSANNHPLLSWSRNNEPDIQHYKIYKWTYAELGWFYYATTTSTSFEDLTETYLTGAHQANEHNVYYRITAVDTQPLESNASNEVQARVAGEALDKKGSDGLFVEKPTEYCLKQNFPNPFNPATNIVYQIPKSGLVQLKVYDLLGSEVSVLVDEIKSEGTYSVNFDASDLPSGVYIYSLRVNDFVQNSKMTFLK